MYSKHVQKNPKTRHKFTFQGDLPKAHHLHTKRSGAPPGGPLGSLPSLILTIKGSWMHLGEGRVAKAVFGPLSPVPRVSTGTALWARFTDPSCRRVFGRAGRCRVQSRRGSDRVPSVDWQSATNRRRTSSRRSAETLPLAAADRRTRRRRSTSESTWSSRRRWSAPPPSTTTTSRRVPESRATSGPTAGTETLHVGRRRDYRSCVVDGLRRRQEAGRRSTDRHSRVVPSSSVAPLTRPVPGRRFPDARRHR